MLKICRWAGSQTVEQAIVDFCEKVGVSPASGK
jgi:hypothetical protein